MRFAITIIIVLVATIVGVGQFGALEVTAKRANIRTAPSLKAPVAFRADKGESLKQQAQFPTAAGWYYVWSEKARRFGWIHKSVVEGFDVYVLGKSNTTATAPTNNKAWTALPGTLFDEYRPADVRRDGDRVTLWIKSPEAAGGYSISLFTADCRAGTWMLHQQTLYDKNKIALKTVTTSRPTFNRAIPDSVGEATVDAMCRLK